MDSLVSFLEDTWQVDNHTDWHQENQGSLETVESHHKKNTFGKTFSVSLNLDVPLTQRSHTLDKLGEHLKPNLECVIQNEIYTGEEAKFNGYDKLIFYMKLKKIHTGENYNEYK